MLKTISLPWYLTMTQPFPDLSELKPSHMFLPDRMIHAFTLRKAHAIRLAQVLTWWEDRINTLPVDDTMKKRLRDCTMRFSCWDRAKKKNNKVWYRTIRRCDRAKLCPWCRQKVVLNLYSRLAPAAENGDLRVFVREGVPEDRKALSRPPRDILASTRNIIYPDGREPVFLATFFTSKEKHSTLEVCTPDDLKDHLALSLSWDLYNKDNQYISNYLEVLGGTRLWSLKPEKYT